MASAAATPAMTPNFMPDDMCTRSPTPGTLSETSGEAPPMNAVPQFGQAVDAKSTEVLQAVHGHVGTSTVATAAAGATGAATTGAATTGAATTGAAATGGATTGAGAAGAGVTAAGAAGAAAMAVAVHGSTPGMAAVRCSVAGS